MTTEAEDINGILVLIETYWNVNTKAADQVIDPTTGINRNILECKFIYENNCMIWFSY